MHNLRDTKRTPQFKTSGSVRFVNVLKEASYDSAILIESRHSYHVNFNCRHRNKLQYKDISTVFLDCTVINSCDGKAEFLAGINLVFSVIIILQKTLQYGDMMKHIIIINVNSSAE